MDGIRINHWSKFGATIRDSRKQLGLSQSELADRARVSRSWLARVEGGHRRAEFEPLLRLLDAIGLDLTLTTSNEKEDSLFATPPEVEEAAQARFKAWSLGNKHD